MKKNKLARSISNEYEKVFSKKGLVLAMIVAIWVVSIYSIYDSLSEGDLVLDELKNNKLNIVNEMNNSYLNYVDEIKTENQLLRRIVNFEINQVDHVEKIDDIYTFDI